MLFYTATFCIIFLPIVLVLYLGFLKLITPEWAKSWLVLCSFCFYGYWEPVYTILLLSSISVNYLIGVRLIESESRILLAVGIILNLGVLAYYKYTGFAFSIISQIFSLDKGSVEILLPLAISFFTFQQIAFLVDCRGGLVVRPQFRDYLLFVTFFPQLIAGPIVHHKEMMPQFREVQKVRNWSTNISVGLVIFAIGMVKKVILADGMAYYSDPLFNLSNQGIALSAQDAWDAALAYTFQIYFDFSGYSDMAIGLAWMFGILLPVNFLSPYKASNISAFWRQWHITLSRFLRDYLFIPLGGNRGKAAIVSRNLMITMMLGGIWHGAGWQFIIWGGLHGVLLTIYHMTRRTTAGGESRLFFTRILAWAVTMFCVIIGWVFFRSESLAGALIHLKSMLGIGAPSRVPTESFFADDPSIGGLFLRHWAFIGLGLIVTLAPNSMTVFEMLRKVNRHCGVFFLSGVSLVVVGIVLLVHLSKAGEGQFIYFNF